MKIRNRILVPTIAATAIASLIAFVTLDYVFQNETRQSLAKATSTKIAGIREREQQVAEQCLTLASLFSRAPMVQQAFVMAHEGSINAENDEHADKARKLLLDELGPFAEGYTASQNGRSFRMHFHLPSGRSLLRLWKTKQSTSDDLSGFRQTVLDINQGKHEPITGIEVGRGGFAIRGIAAVTGSDGQHLGSIEVLSDYLPVVETAKENAQENLAVYMNADLSPIATRLNNRGKYPLIEQRYIRVMSSDTQLTDTLVPANLMERGKENTTTERFGKYQITVFPVTDYRSKNIGTVAVVNDLSLVLAQSERLRTGIALGAGLLLLALACTAHLVSRSISRPLRKGVQFAGRVAEGDLSGRLDEKRKDEIGDLARALDHMANNLQGMIEDVDQAAERERLAESMREEIEQAAADRERMQQRENEKQAAEKNRLEEKRELKEIESKKQQQQAEKERAKVDNLLRVVAAAAEGDLTNQIDNEGDDLIDELAQGIQGMLDDLSGVIHQVTDVAEQFNETSRVIGESSQSLVQGAQIQSTSVDEMSASVQELAASIDGVNKLAVEADTLATQANGLAQRGGTAVQKSIESMEAIRDSSNQVSKFSDVISEIAAQTHLLALNATIEAARAGEQGLGFAVVADEVRKLAHRSNEAAGEISSLIKTSSQLIQEGVNRSDEADVALKEILTGVDTTVGKISQIASVTVDQADNAKQVAKAVQSISQVAEHSASNSKEMATNSEQLGTQAKVLGTLTTRFKT